MQHQHGGDIYSREVRWDFSVNLNPLGMPDEVRRAAIAGVECSDRYPDVECRQLRAALAAREQVNPEQIIFGNGAAELIFQIVQAVKPRTALLVTPGFAEYEQALRARGTVIHDYPCRAEHDFAVREDFLKYITDKTDIVFLCNPNNPTGLPVEKKLMRRIIKACHRHGTILVVDECFNGLWPDGEAQSVKSWLDEYHELFILKAFTKLYSMAGLRLGYGLCANRVLMYEIRRQCQPWNISIPAQMGGLAALELPGFVNKTREIVAEELAYLKHAFAALDIQYWESEANYLFFAGPEDLQSRCLEKGLLLRSCANYRGLGPGYFRAAVKNREENEQLIRVLTEVLEEKKNHG